MSNEITPSDLGKRTREIAEFYFQNPTMSRKDMAAKLGVGESRISRVLTHPKVRACYKVLAQQMQKDMIPLASKVQRDLMAKGQNEAVREKVAARVLASEKVLDNAQEIRIQSDITIKSVSELQQIISSAIQSPQPDVVDAELVDDAPDTTHPTIQPDTLQHKPIE